ncbi:hypothetical protein J3L16_09380 [Alteromonas sp. 5E99-2]|uniref:hypothetical protein n=1 Tax=Alteromonas sp. 5E99-2 TaxID=2817683 RepID=UPI001A98D17B|nr:hypothetical protein [Alteromonas sp. 5E99-2]MBO1255893.1 hypothetical protein [Alteromonas sp. 5E99-2]
MLNNNNSILKRAFYLLCIGLSFGCSSFLAYAGDVAIHSANFERKENGLWRVSVTLKHNDEGWNHYADRWRIVDEEGLQLAIRVLQHPHQQEQPFTRSLTNVGIPKDARYVYVEAGDNKHGWTKKRLKVDLNKVVNGKLRAKP